MKQQQRIRWWDDDPLPVVAPWTRRKFQLEAKANTFARWDVDGKQSALLAMATGTGKTLVAGKGIIAQWLADNRGEVLWLAHLDTLVEQARSDLVGYLGEPVGREQGPLRWADERVCVASVCTLYQEIRLRTLALRAPTLIVIDEARHYVADANRKVIEAFPGAKRLLLDATPYRHDGKSLSSICESVALEYTFNEGIKDGYLVPVETYTARVKGYDVANFRKQDLDNDKAVAKMVGQDEVLRGIIDAVVSKVGDRKTLWFFPTVHVAHLAADVLNMIKPGSATVVDGTKMDKRVKSNRLKQFKIDETQHLCNVQLTAEGWNYPGLHCVVIAKVVISFGHFIQILGRPMRPLADVDVYDTPEERRACIARSTKPKMLVIDFCGNAGRHADRIVSAIDLLAGKDVDAETITRAKKISEERPIAPEEAIDKAKAELASEKRAEAERVAKAEAVKFELHNVDEFSDFDQQAKASRLLDRVSIQQYVQFKAFGFPRSRVPKSGIAAQAILAKLRARKDAGLASWKQVHFLLANGLQAKQWSAKTAGIVIGEMKRDADAHGRPHWQCRAPSAEFIREAMTLQREPGWDG